MSALLVLAEKVEAAAGPSRELDAEIDAALKLAPEGFVLFDTPRFTSNIGASLTLLGPDDFWSVSNTGSALVAIGGGEAIESRANTAELAFISAILRARAAAQPVGEARDG